jgi:hypothetical protein
MIGSYGWVVSILRLTVVEAKEEKAEDEAI